jgi:hypothetical protein
MSGTVRDGQAGRLSRPGALPLFAELMSAVESATSDPHTASASSVVRDVHEEAPVSRSTRSNRDY